MTGGRKTKCTPELIKKIGQALRSGTTIKGACRYVGISESTYHNWCKRAREELERVNEDARRSVRKSEAPFVEFLETSMRARGAAEVEAVTRIKQAAAEDWKAAAWYLEHAHGKRWGKKRLDVTSNDEKIDVGPVLYYPETERRRGDD